MPALLILKKQILIDDYTEVVLIKQIVSEIAILVVTIGTSRNRKSRKINPLSKYCDIIRWLSDVTFVGSFTNGQILAQIRLSTKCKTWPGCPNSSS